MLNRGAVVGNPVARAELSEYRHIELSTVVVSQNSGDTELVKDVFHHKSFHFFSVMVAKGSASSNLVK